MFKRNMSRQIVLDTETTGLDPKTGHRIIEVGCVELRERRLTGNNLHLYLQPDREIDHQAIEVHGISNEFLIDKPRFEEVAAELKAYLSGAELLIHNAPFDVGFLESEFSIIGDNFPLTSICSVTDAILSMRYANGLVSKTGIERCTAHCWIRKFWPMFILP